MAEPDVLADGAAALAESPPLLLSVVVPVFNQAASIIENLRVIRERIGAELGEEFEIIVVSDGSIDATEGELVAQAPKGAFRVFHYDRNLGKGFAVKLGALEATGRWIGFVDADLDLDPGDLATYVRRAEDEGLDFAIGSKRHPASHVHYPRSRVVASWLFQQLVRILFRLNVRDTQVGLKVFRREVAEQVLPLLLVKRFAFDIELLSVARAFGFDRIEEMPVRLEYRFTGSGVRSRAVLRALIDTAAIFYRLRILRYYQRRRRLGGAFGWTRPRSTKPSVSVVVARGGQFQERDYPHLELIEVADFAMQSLRPAAHAARGEVIAFLEPGARPAANWLSATAPFLARPEVSAVVTPKVSPATGSLALRGAAAVHESRIGAGPVYFRYTPGNIRYVDNFPTATFVVRREAFLGLSEDVTVEQAAGALASSGARVLYTPESVIVAEPPALFRPHLSRVFARGVARGRFFRRARTLQTSVFVLTVALAPLALIAAIVVGGVLREAALMLIGIYALAVLLAALAATIRFQSLAVGALAAAGIVSTHVTYLAGAARGLARG